MTPSISAQLLVAGPDEGPRLTLVPSSGSAGIAVQVMGKGFEGNCRVELFLFDSTEPPSLAFASVGKDGTFTAQITIPQDAAAGEHQIVAQGHEFRDDGSCGGPSGSKANALFVVLEPTVDHNIYLRNRMLKDPLIDRAFLKKITESQEPVHGIVQLNSLPRPGDLGIIRELGIDLLGYLNGITASGTAYLASISPGVAYDDPRFEELVRGLQRLVADDKLETELLLTMNLPNPSSEPVSVLVLFFDDVTAEKATAVFMRNGLEARRQGESKTWEASASPDQIRGLAEEDVVQWIEPGPGPYLPTVDVARALSNVDQVQQLDIATGVYAGLSGADVQIGIMDTGIDHHHNDFAGRILRRQGLVDARCDPDRALPGPDNHGDINNHGTHVAGIAAGSGVQSNQTNDATPPQPNGGTAFQWRGMAPRAGIAAYGQSGGDARCYADAINKLRVDVTNHSYVLDMQGLYSGDVANVDGIVRGDSPGIPPRPVVWAAANNASVGPRDCNGGGIPDGNFPQYPFPNVPVPPMGNPVPPVPALPGGPPAPAFPGGPPCPPAFQAGYFSVLAPCKNCIVVASVDNNRVHAFDSGLGPTMDGRLKPDVSAMGNPVFATGGDTDQQGNTVPGNDYEFKRGTSMAAPVVTGIIALMLEQYAATFGAIPPLPSTLKAILVQTATDLADTDPTINFDTGNPTNYAVGPDWATGYGLVNAQAAVQMIRDRLFIQDQFSETDPIDEFTFPVATGQTEVRVTLAWDDRSGNPNLSPVAPQLVNDLDLVLIDPNGVEFRPLVLPLVMPTDCDGTPGNGVQVGTCIGQDAAGQNYVGPAVERADRRNNVEQVVVRTGVTPGTWKALVSVQALNGTLRLPMGGNQSYSLAGGPSEPDDFVTVAITKLVEFGGTEIDGPPSGSIFGGTTIHRGDFYAVVTINGVTTSSFNNRIQGRDIECGGFLVGCILPSQNDVITQYGLNQLWQFSRAIPPNLPPVNIRIEIWDDDDNPDDVARLKFAGDEALNFVFDPNTRQVSGDVNSPQGCSSGFRSDGARLPGSNPVEVCFEVSSLP